VSYKCGEISLIFQLVHVSIMSLSSKVAWASFYIIGGLRWHGVEIHYHYCHSPLATCESNFRAMNSTHDVDFVSQNDVTGTRDIYLNLNLFHIPNLITD
jgi:hypothetical protein